LRRLAERLPGLIQSAEPDVRLRSTYSATFGSSKFFRAATFEDVLRARSVLDRLAWDDPFTAQFATVAGLAALIPCSELRRAGDLRFRRPDEFDDRQEYTSYFSHQLTIIADDLDGAERLRMTPVLVVSDARNLDGLPSLEIDAVVTSPPYLNGTNYFR